MSDFVKTLVLHTSISSLIRINPADDIVGWSIRLATSQSGKNPSPSPCVVPRCSLPSAVAHKSGHTLYGLPSDQGTAGRYRHHRRPRNDGHQVPSELEAVAPMLDSLRMVPLRRIQPQRCVLPQIDSGRKSGRSVPRSMTHTMCNCSALSARVNRPWNNRRRPRSETVAGSRRSACAPRGYPRTC